MSESPDMKQGRARRFDLPPREGIANREAAFILAALDEFHERLFDVVVDLEPQALDFLPEGGSNTIAMLVRHMAFAEAYWVSNVTRKTLPEALKEHLQAGAQDPSKGALPESSATAEELTALCKEVRENFTVDVLADIEDIDRIEVLDDREATLRGVLLNQLWHWTYHSGQVGYLRGMLGQRYQWRYGKEICAPGAHH
jgi:uncharacterized damage-inducible protein DinB